MPDVKAFIEKKPGDLVLSDDWNNAQIQSRTALQQHNHSGTGDNASPIATNGIQDGAITTAKLANNAVTDAKINDVDAGKITGAIKVSNGNLGIGTTSPASKLQIVGGTDVTTVNTTGFLILGNHTDTHLAIDNNEIQARNASSASTLYIQSEGGNTCINETTGNLGIGTATPLSKLSITPGTTEAKITLWDGGSSTNHYGFGISGGQLNYHVDNSGAKHVFYATGKNGNGTELMRIQGDGNVGIGTASPTAKLSVSGGAIQPSAGNSETSGIMFPKDPGAGGGDAAWIRYYVRSGESTTLEIGTSNDPDDHIALMPGTGNVGIGINNPTRAKLEISGSVRSTLASYCYLRNIAGSQIGGPVTITMDYSIYAGQHVAAAEFHAFSDERIKEIVGLSNADQDLATLEKIEIVDYHYKDKVSKGNKLHKKVIGQQVAQVFPQVVDQVKEEVVPDIMQKASMTKGLVHLTDHGLAIEEEIEIITLEDKKVCYKVKAIEDKDRFQLDTEESAEVIFVYGRKVNDFHVVDYEGIAMLNVSATQALSAKVKEQQAEIEILKAKIEQLLAK